MPYRKKKFFRKFRKTYKRSGKYGAKTVTLYRRKELRALPDIHNFTRSIVSYFNIDIGQLTGFTTDTNLGLYKYAWSNGAAVAPNADNFQLLSLPNVTEFSNLFDQYQISGVLTTVRYTCNTATASSKLGLPTLYWCYDNDDGTAITSMAELTQRKHSSKLLSSPAKIFCRPSTVSEIYRSALTTGYAPDWKKWIDMTTTDIPHYGIKFFLLLPTSTLTADTDHDYPGKIIVEHKYYMRFRGIR